MVLIKDCIPVYEKYNDEVRSSTLRDERCIICYLSVKPEDIIHTRFKICSRCQVMIKSVKEEDDPIYNRLRLPTHSDTERELSLVKLSMHSLLREIKESQVSLTLRAKLIEDMIKITPLDISNLNIILFCTFRVVKGNHLHPRLLLNLLHELKEADHISTLTYEHYKKRVLKLSHARFE